MQPFTIGLRSHVAGDEILIECESTVGLVDLQDDVVVDALTGALDGGGAVKLCVDPRVGKHQDRIYVRRDILFDPDSTRLADVRAMFGSTLSVFQYEDEPERRALRGGESGWGPRG